MMNKVGKEEFEKLSDLPEWSVFDLSDTLFDKFLLFFQLEAAVSAERKDGKGEKSKCAKATARAEGGGKAGEGENKTLEEAKEFQDLEASFAEVSCSAAEQVLLGGSFFGNEKF